MLKKIDPVRGRKLGKQGIILRLLVPYVKKNRPRKGTETKMRKEFYKEYERVNVLKKIDPVRGRKQL